MTKPINHDGAEGAVVEEPESARGVGERSRAANRQRQAKFRRAQIERGRVECKVYVRRDQVAKAKRLAVAEPSTFNDIIERALVIGLGTLARRQGARNRPTQIDLPVLNAVGQDQNGEPTSLTAR